MCEMFLFNRLIFPYFHSGIKYSIQVETKRKKQGLPSRAVFVQPTSTDTDYESTGVMELKKQNEQKCVTKTLKLQVQQTQKQVVR